MKEHKAQYYEATKVGELKYKRIPKLTQHLCETEGVI